MANPIIMQSPSPSTTFAGMPSGSTYVPSPAGIILITNGSVADQQALMAAGCQTLTPVVGGALVALAGASYTVKTTDAGNILMFTNIGAAAVTLPNSFPQGFVIQLLQGSTGVVTASVQSGGAALTPAATASSTAEGGSLVCTVLSNTSGTNAVWDIVPTPQFNTNLAAAAVTAVSAANVAAAFINAPTGSEAVGAVYIVGASPTGAFAGQANAIAYLQGAAQWVFTAPTGGEKMYVQTPGQRYTFLSGAWTQDAVPSAVTQFAAPVAAATTAALAANTYANGTAGVGATLTGNANGALAAIDGVSPTTSMRLWIKNEAAPANNGVYSVTQVGSGSAPYIVTRTTDADTAALLGGMAAFVTGGAANIGNTYAQQLPAGSITVGTTALNIVQIGGPGGVAAETARAEAAEAAIAGNLTTEVSRAEAAEAALAVTANADNAALAGYVDPLVTTGGTPSASYDNPYTGDCTSNNVVTTNAIAKQLQDITFNCVSVGNGTAVLLLYLQETANGVQGPIIGVVPITGITATGVQTASAGAASGPAFPAGYTVPPGTETFLGSASGGAVFGTTVSTGNGRNLLASAAGYDHTPTASNVISGHQVTLASPTTVVSDVNTVRAVAQVALTASSADLIVENDAPSSIQFNGVAGQDINYPLGSGCPVQGSGLFTSVVYNGAQAGTMDFNVFRATALDAYGQMTAGYLLGGFRGTIVAANYQTLAVPTPFEVQAGTDFLICTPITGMLGSASWSNPDGLYPATAADYTNSTFTYIARTPAVMMRITRPKTPQEFELDIGRRYVTVANPSFASLPSATWTPYAGSWTVSGNELVPPTSTGDYTHAYQYNYLDCSKQRRGSVRWRMTTTTAVFYAAWNPTGGMIGSLGTIAVMDFSAGASAGVVYVGSWLGPGNAPVFGSSVAVPWTADTTNQVVYEYVIHRAKVTHTWTSMLTGQSVSITTAPQGSNVTGVPGGMCTGQFCVGNYSGGANVQNMQIQLQQATKILLADSEVEGTVLGEAYNKSWAYRVEDARGKSDLLICAANGATTTNGRSFAQIALLANPNADIINCLGVNPSNSGGTSNSQRAATNASDHVATAAMTTGKYSIVSPAPAASQATYIGLVLGGLVANTTIPGVEWANITNAMSVSGAGAAIVPSWTIDGLHFSLLGTPVVQGLVQSQIVGLQ